MNKINIIINDEEQEILSRRTENLSQAVKVTEVKTDDKIEYLCFKVNNISYAIEQSYIQELHMEIHPKKIPSVPKFIKGIVNIRGDILSITDISEFFENEPIQERKSYQMFRIKYKKLEFGVIVDDIEDIISIGKSDIHPFLSSDNTKIGKFLKGVNAKMVNIIDAESLMNDASIIVNNNNS